MKDAAADFVFEIGCEEIPAGLLPGAISEFKAILEKHLSANRLIGEGSVVETLGAPRRLTAVCTGILSKQPDDIREMTGPPKSVAFDSAGNPTKEAEGFARKFGVPVSKLVIVNTRRGEYLAARQLVPGRKSKELLEEICPRVAVELTWPRSMYWAGASGMRFIRPIRWVVAVVGGVPLKFALGDAHAGKFSRGHRFLGSSSVAIAGAKDYAPKLRKNFVLVRPEDRKKKIEDEIRKLTGGRGLRLHEDPALMEMVTYLNEYPSAIMGGFDPGYLALPQEILITVMRGHQKYFAVEKKDGSLAPYFVAIINLDKDRAGLIRAGHERVLRARFADARFFWETDQKCRLADYLPKLAAVTFHAKLGSYGQKVERVRVLSRWLAEHWFSSGIAESSVAAADRAAELAKCDLVTGMVREFTELQGVVGGLYAEAQEEPEEVALAVYDQYKPSSLDDSIPRNLTGQTISLADKLDTLVGCFAVGLTPSGSSDPLALRRAAMGVVRIIVENGLPVSLSAVVARAARTLASVELGFKINLKPQVETQVVDFLLDRARFVLKERANFAYDEINAAFAAGSDDLVDAIRRIKALQAIRKTKNFEALAVSFKRIRKILEKAGPESDWKFSAVRPDLFRDDAERQLHAQAGKIERESEQHKKAGRYRDALQGIATLRPAVDRFFDDVMVMTEEEDLRRNRLTLLAQLFSEFSTIADFSEIATS